MVYDAALPQRAVELYGLPKNEHIQNCPTKRNMLTGDSDVGLMALAVSGSTTASFVQQCWFATHWRHDKMSEYRHALEGSDRRNLVIGPLTDGPSLYCFWVQMYCYNTIAYVSTNEESRNQRC
jgi:hypothetical protein